MKSLALQSKHQKLALSIFDNMKNPCMECHACKVTVIHNISHSQTKFQGLARGKNEGDTWEEISSILDPLV